MDIAKIEKFLNCSGIIFVSYVGMLSQELISNMTEALEKETVKNNVSMSTSVNIFTIFVELSQNILNYSKSKNEHIKELEPKGLVLVGYDKEDDSYYVVSTNVIDRIDKDNISPKLTEIKSMNRDEIKKTYRELRKSGRDSHGKGAGIGFYEISKRCDNIDFKFTPINDNKFQFIFQSNITNKQKIGE